MTSTISQLNSSIFERLRLCNEYASLCGQLEEILNSGRFEVSRAKSINGYSLSEIALQSESRDMAAQVGVSISGTSFSLNTIVAEESEEKSEKTKIRKRNVPKQDSDKNDDEEEEKEVKKVVPNFRPFGLLEPQPARQARKEFSKALEVVCTLASLRATIGKLDEKLAELQEKLKEEPEQLEKIMQSLKV